MEHARTSMQRKQISIILPNGVRILSTLNPSAKEFYPSYMMHENPGLRQVATPPSCDDYESEEYAEYTFNEMGGMEHYEGETPGMYSLTPDYFETVDQIPGEPIDDEWKNGLEYYHEGNYTGQKHDKTFMNLSDKPLPMKEKPIEPLMGHNFCGDYLIMKESETELDEAAGGEGQVDQGKEVNLVIERPLVRRVRGILWTDDVEGDVFDRNSMTSESLPEVSSSEHTNIDNNIEKANSEKAIIVEKVVEPQQQAPEPQPQPQPEPIKKQSPVITKKIIGTVKKTAASPNAQPDTSPKKNIGAPQTLAEKQSDAVALGEKVVDEKPLNEKRSNEKPCVSKYANTATMRMSRAKEVADRAHDIATKSRTSVTVEPKRVFCHCGKLRTRSTSATGIVKSTRRVVNFARTTTDTNVVAVKREFIARKLTKEPVPVPSTGTTKKTVVPRSFFSTSTMPSTTTKPTAPKPNFNAVPPKAVEKKGKAAATAAKPATATAATKDSSGAKVLPPSGAGSKLVAAPRATKGKLNPSSS